MLLRHIPSFMITLWKPSRGAKKHKDAAHSYATVTNAKYGGKKAPRSSSGPNQQLLDPNQVQNLTAA